MLNEVEIVKAKSLNDKYDFLRRSLISYYSRCMNVEESQQRHYSVPFSDFSEMMKFYEDMFYKFLREEYRNDNR